uniref:Protein inscuteable homologue C-terminal domain-containing protein n=1 Tax=Musca domestica TaxID=7370 RepID=T1PCD4_MUSDO
MVATLMNIDYDGFASLTDAFVQTEAVRTLLVVCLDNKLSSVRAQALRALATICCAPEPIFQLGHCGGIEVIRDILQIEGGDANKKPKENEVKRSDLERREAVSLLTQITAAWHGPEHRVDGLKDCVETVVEGLTRLLVFTECPQTLLLCAAALNNLSRMEITSHYSIMSHETIYKLVETMERRDEGITVFLYEQIVAMLYNMSLNKKCHSHLANANIVNFITYAYQTEFYKIYSTRGESEAQQRCIKTILHTLTRLAQDSVLGMELLTQQNHLPSAFFFSLTPNSTSSTATDTQRSPEFYEQQQMLPLDISTSRDISFLARQLSEHQQQRHHHQYPGFKENNELNMEPKEYGGNTLKMQLQRQESYV